MDTHTNSNSTRKLLRLAMMAPEILMVPCVFDRYSVWLMEQAGYQAAHHRCRPERSQARVAERGHYGVPR
jgi:hypothetical protein